MTKNAAIDEERDASKAVSIIDCKLLIWEGVNWSKTRKKSLVNSTALCPLGNKLLAMDSTRISIGIIFKNNAHERPAALIIQSSLKKWLKED